MNTTSLTAVMAMMVAAGSAQAGVVGEQLTAVVSGSNTVDTKGYFGQAGANLTGKTISLFFQYTTQAFGPAKACRDPSYCSYNISKGNAGTQGSVVVTAQIDGHRVVFTPAYQGTVLFTKKFQNRVFIDSDVFSGFGLGLPGCQLLIDYTGKVAFGSQVSPINQPVVNASSDEIDFFDASSQVSVEQLTFTNVKRAQ